MWPDRATAGPALRCVCKRRRASMIDRRHFLIGAGALLTASFVRRASVFSKETGRPLILPAVQEPEETLYVYWQADSEVANWGVSLGPDQPFAPPPPTWREHLRSLGHPLETDDEIERACRKYDLPVDDLDTRLNGFGWKARSARDILDLGRAELLLQDISILPSGGSVLVVLWRAGLSPARRLTSQNGMSSSGPS